MSNQNACIRIAALLLLLQLAACDSPTDTQPEAEPENQAAVAESTVTQQPVRPPRPEVDPAVKAANQARRQAAQAEREAARQARRDAEPTDKPAKTPAEKAAQREQKRIQRLTNKSWWNKKSGNKSLNLEADQIASLDGRLQQLLDEQKQLAQQLSTLHEANRLALQAGSVTQLENNLNDIAELEQRWLKARHAATVDMLEALTAEQLRQLAAQGGEIASLEWMDFELDKAIVKAEITPEQRQQLRQQRRQQRQANQNNDN